MSSSRLQTKRNRGLEPKQKDRPETDGLKKGTVRDASNNRKSFVVLLRLAVLSSLKRNFLLSGSFDVTAASLSFFSKMSRLLLGEQNEQEDGDIPLTKE